MKYIIYKIFNFLTSKNKTKVNNELLKIPSSQIFHNYHPKFTLQKIALNETIEYIKLNMNKALIFDYYLDNLRYAISRLTIDNGLHLEFGVFKGKIINMIAESLPKKKIYGFDSFDGLPED